MQTYHLILKSPVSTSFRAKKAAHSVDLNIEEKSTHEVVLNADLKSDFDIGLIYGASGTGKSSIARHIFGDEILHSFQFDPDKAVIDQFPDDWTYEQSQEWLNGIGLTSVPCWIKPMKTLSTGQLARADAVLKLAHSKGITVIDEWTSVVDRTVGKIMSHSVQKFVRKQKKKLILISCHHDVVEWLDPDWVMDLNHQKWIDRRLLPKIERERKERFEFTVRECGREAWKRFSKYHYLSSILPGAKNYWFGLFLENEQIGFLGFTNYTPIRKNSFPIFHSNRVVLLPEYVGLGIGLRFVTECAKIMKAKYRVRIMAKLSALPMIRARLKRPKEWRLVKIEKNVGQAWIAKTCKSIERKGGFRTNVKTYSFEFIG